MSANGKQDADRDKNKTPARDKRRCCELFNVQQRALHKEHLKPALSWTVKRKLPLALAIEGYVCRGCRHVLYKVWAI
ncbi:unnamed protein product [Lasius platythorax]|uniref:Uncharacterized protein n=1 Tax=Lasius platythorax TaxID=488582 RepID=A0AAV2NNL8_9HYME